MGKSRASWGYIRKLASGRYQASYTVDGQRYTAPHTFDGKEAADVWLAQCRARISLGQWKSPEQEAAEREAEAKRRAAQKFGPYSATWLEQRVNGKGEPLRVKTRTEYERMLRRGLAVFASDQIEDITPARVRAWHTGRAKTAPTMAGGEARLLRAILNTAAMDGIIDKNPVPGNLTRTHTGIKHRPPTSGELAVILDHMQGRYRLAVLLAAYGGLRRGEWAALRRRDILIGADRVRVNVERACQYIAGTGWHVGPPKSAEGVRIVPLPAQVTADVEAHLAEHVGPFPDDLLFPGRDGFQHPMAFNKVWDAARDAAGVRAVVREHDLRAYAATSFAVAGGTMAETMRLLGHSTTAAAMAYQHAATERMDALADRLGAPDAAPVVKIDERRRHGK